MIGSGEETDWPNLPSHDGIDEKLVAIPKFPTREIYSPPAILGTGAAISSEEDYKRLYEESINSPGTFWGRVATDLVRWMVPYRTVTRCDMKTGNFCWFEGGKLNVCDNCVDRWATTHPDKTALIVEPNSVADRTFISYAQLLDQVCRLANLLYSLGISKGDTVAIYMPMIAEAVYAMLACARIGAVHSVVFGGYSAACLAERCNHCSARLLITADYGFRGKKIIHLKDTCDIALESARTVTNCIVFRRVVDEKHGIKPVHMRPDRDIDGLASMKKMRPYCPPAELDSEDLLFILYTSGSTGVPKGIVHSTAGYLVHAALSHKWVFDYRPNDIYACFADCGWITGHSYVIYGPLCNGATTVVFETLPTFPNPGRYWQLVEELRLSQIYTAPTAIRLLMKHDSEEWPDKYDLSSLRVIGSVGEPLNPEAWRWLYTKVGKQRCAVVDTYWQTETGGHMLTPLPGVTPMKPGSSAWPFFGVQPLLIDAQTGLMLEGPNVSGLLCITAPWPGIMRTILGDHTRVLNSYLSSGANYYFTGDGAYRDEDGYYWISGRVDDTLNISGHRIATAEIEHALSSDASVAECAAVGFPHSLKGTGIYCFVVLKECCKAAVDSEHRSLTTLLASLRQAVREGIGPMANPDNLLLVPNLPKTRSGKIMRRILRKLVSGQEDFGDVSTLANPEVLDTLRSLVEKS